MRGLTKPTPGEPKFRVVTGEIDGALTSPPFLSIKTNHSPTVGFLPITFYFWQAKDLRLKKNG